MGSTWRTFAPVLLALFVNDIRRRDIGELLPILRNLSRTGRSFLIGQQISNATAHCAFCSFQQMASALRRERICFSNRLINFQQIAVFKNRKRYFFTVIFSFRIIIDKNLVLFFEL